MNSIAANNFFINTADLNPLSPYLQTILNKKVNGKALTCFQLIVHWFLTTFSCCYPAYNRLYNEAQVAEIGQNREIDHSPYSPKTTSRIRLTIDIPSPPGPLIITMPLSPISSPIHKTEESKTTQL